MATPYSDEAERARASRCCTRGTCWRSTRRRTCRAVWRGNCSKCDRHSPRPPIDILARLPGVEKTSSRSRDRAHVRVAPGAQESVTQAINAALGAAGIGGISVRPIAASLEDVFIDLITGHRC
jgi:hypothetical protein